MAAVEFLAVDDYYAYMGEMGPTELEFLGELLDTANFKMMPGWKEPTVRLTDYFFLDSAGNYVPVDGDLDEGVFLHGNVTSWDGDGGDSFLIGNVTVRFWSVHLKDWVSFVSWGVFGQLFLSV